MTRNRLKLLLIPILAALAAMPSLARVAFNGYAQQGGTLTAAGINVVPTALQTFPGATLTVYITGGASGTVTTSGTAVTWVSGTLFNANGQWNGLTIGINSVNYTISSCSSTTSCTLTGSAGVQSTTVAYSIATAPAAIFSDNMSTTLSNPFNVNGTTASFQFYADNGTYDLTFSGAGIASPFTRGAQSGIDPFYIRGPVVIVGNGPYPSQFSENSVFNTGSTMLQPISNNVAQRLDLYPSGTASNSVFAIWNASTPNQAYGIAMQLTGAGNVANLTIVQSISGGTPAVPITTLNIGENQTIGNLTVENHYFNGVIKAALANTGVWTWSAYGAGLLHSSSGGALTSSAVSLTADVSGTLPVGNGGTGLTTYTSGGILCATGTTTLASSAALTANVYVVGGGAGACPASLSPAFGTLTDGATVTWAMGSSVVANDTLTFTTHGGSRTLNITGPVNGGTYALQLIQDSTGGEGLTLGSGCTWKVSGGGSGAITPSTGPGARDILTFTYDGTNCYATLTKNFN